jgi:hypothetical protein
MGIGMLFFIRFSRDGLESCWDEQGVEEILGWDSYHHEELETTVGAKLAKKVVKRIAADGLDYALFSKDERTALDTVLSSLFSIEHQDVLWGALDAKDLGDLPIPPVRRLRARAVELGSEGLLPVLLEGRRLDSHEVPTGRRYAMLAPEESAAIAEHVRKTIAAGGLSKTDVRDLEKRFLPVLDKVVNDDDWLFVGGQG